MMKMLRRYGVVLMGAAAIAGATGMATASAVPAPAGGTSPSVVNACDQNVAPGQFTCLSMRRADLGFSSRTKYTPHSTNPQLTPTGYGPSSLAAAYALPTTSAGAGKRVYIVDAYNDPTAESDLAVYRNQYGLPACTSASGCFQQLNGNGTTSPLPATNTGWAQEISLDLDMVSAICPNCSITLVESADNGNSLFAAVQEAAKLGAKYISMSWGGTESGSEASYDSTYFTASGVVYSASTGDDAYGGGVLYPASSPDVVAVGGTSLTATSANARGWTESAWKTSSTEGAGSGCSSDEAKPTWQSVVPSTVCSRRAIADVSAVADPQTGVAVYLTTGGGGWAVYGGTSAAAPIIASTYALAGTPASTDKPGSYPYGHTANLNDVTTGNTGTCSPSLLCTAAAGWDGPTGLGTPNGLGAFSAAGGTTPPPPANTVTVTNPGNQSSTVNQAVSLPITAKDSGSSTLTYSATGLPTGLSINASSGLISGTISATGSYSVTVTARDTTGVTGSAAFTWTVTSAAGGACTAAQLLKNPGFESGATSWSATSGVVNTSGGHGRTGIGYAWLDGYGASHTDTLSQAVTIPSGCHATLSYYLSITSNDTGTTPHDVLTVTVNGSALQSFSNVNRGTGYVLRTVDLSAFAGQTVTLKWTGVEDSSKATNFFLDDTSLQTS